MRKLYIDFDGVIVDSIKPTRLEMKLHNIDLNNHDMVREYYEHLDWEKLLSEVELIDNSISKLKEIIASKLFDVSILTHINSVHEIVAKTNFLRNNDIEVPIIPVPYEIPKHVAIKPKGAILIDDISKNVNDWINHGGVGYHFIKGNTRLPIITNLTEILAN